MVRSLKFKFLLLKKASQGKLHFIWSVFLVMGLFIFYQTTVPSLLLGLLGISLINKIINSNLIENETWIQSIAFHPIFHTKKKSIFNNLTSDFLLKFFLLGPVITYMLILNPKISSVLLALGFIIIDNFLIFFLTELSCKYAKYSKIFKYLILLNIFLCLSFFTALRPNEKLRELFEENFSFFLNIIFCIIFALLFVMTLVYNNSYSKTEND